jgi:hypothetical protein
MATWLLPEAFSSDLSGDVFCSLTMAIRQRCYADCFRGASRQTTCHAIYTGQCACVGCRRRRRIESLACLLCFIGALVASSGDDDEEEDTTSTFAATTTTATHTSEMRRVACGVALLVLCPALYSVGWCVRIKGTRSRPFVSFVCVRFGTRVGAASIGHPICFRIGNVVSLRRSSNRNARGYPFDACNTKEQWLESTAIYPIFISCHYSGGGGGSGRGAWNKFGGLSCGRNACNAARVSPVSGGA